MPSHSTILLLFSVTGSVIGQITDYCFQWRYEDALNYKVTGCCRRFVPQEVRGETGVQCRGAGVDMLPNCGENWKLCRVRSHLEYGRTGKRANGPTPGLCSSVYSYFLK